MSQPGNPFPTMVHESSPPEPDEAACAATRRGIAAMIHSSVRGEVAQAVRGHLVQCEACAASYRTAMAQAAQAGGGLRAARVKRERARRHDELKRLSRSAGGRSPRSRLWLQSFVVCAALIFLLTRLPLLGEGATLRLVRADGSAFAAGARVLAGDEPELGRGDSCLTGAASAAELTSGDTRLVLGERGALFVEQGAGPDGPRVRLMQGALRLDGSAVVTTQYGVITLAEGRARLALDPAGGSVTCDGGDLDVLGPLGRRTVAAGQTLELALGP